MHIRTYVPKSLLYHLFCSNEKYLQFYDADKNECIDLSNFVTDEDIKQIKNGDLDGFWYDSALAETIMVIYYLGSFKMLQINTNPFFIQKRKTSYLTKNETDDQFWNDLSNRLMMSYFAEYHSNDYYFLLFVV